MNEAFYLLFVTCLSGALVSAEYLVHMYINGNWRGPEIFRSIVLHLVMNGLVSVIVTVRFDSVLLHLLSLLLDGFSCHVLLLFH